jgi:hypothetical protein
MIPEKLTKIQWQRFLAGTSPPDTDYGKFCQEVFNRYNAHEGLETILGSANSDVKRLSEYCDKLKKIVEGLLGACRPLANLPISDCDNRANGTPLFGRNLGADIEGLITVGDVRKAKDAITSAEAK